MLSVDWFVYSSVKCEVCDWDSMVCVRVISGVMFDFVVMLMMCLLLRLFSVEVNVFCGFIMLMWNFGCRLVCV